MSMRILGIGTATPERRISQEHAAHLAASFSPDRERPRALAAIYRQTRIRSRGSVLLDDPGRHGFAQSFFPPATADAPGGPSTATRMRRYATEAAPLALRAARRAIEAAAIPPSAITHLVTCSCTGFSSPGFDIEVIRSLGIAASVSRTHLGFMGCHGAFNAMRVASAFAESDPRSVPLVVCVELCSLHFQYGSSSDVVVANSIFADGAAAFVGAAASGGGHPPGDWTLCRQWSALIPDSHHEMGWMIGDHGFEMSLSAAVPATVGRHLPGIVDAACAEAGLERRAIAAWGVHPGGPRLLSGVEDALGLPAAALAASRGVLAEHGNMSSGTILFILERLRREGVRGPCMAMAFGPGLTVELALLSGP